MKNIIIGGFPGIGKSWLSRQSHDLVIQDCDSGDFSWQNRDLRIRHRYWPFNYLLHIVGNSEKSDILLISTDKEIRDGMVALKIPFTLVYPSVQMKDEFIERYMNRESTPTFVDILTRNYEEWIADIQAQQGCKHVMLEPGQYLADVIPQILQ